MNLRQVLEFLKSRCLLLKIKIFANENNNYKTIFLGLFNNKKDAARIYNQNAKELYGDFGKLNYISDNE